MFHDVPEDETAQMLGLTAAEVYGVDVDKLARIVERIGPTLDEVHGDAPSTRPDSRRSRRHHVDGEHPYETFVGLPMPRNPSRCSIADGARSCACGP